MADAKKEKDAAEEKDGKKEGAEGEGAENAEGAEGDGGGGKKAKIKKILLFVVAPVVLLLALSAGAYFMGFLDKFLPPKEINCEKVAEGDKDYAFCAEKKAAEDAAKPGAFLEVPNMIVNLNSLSKQPRFLKISLKVELDNEEEKAKIEPLLPRVIDQFQMYLRELRLEDLRGTSGVYRMKIELLSRVRAAAPNIKIRDVLFQEVLVQ